MWCHVHKLCTSCGLSGYLTPACPLHNIFIIEDIRAIAHTDLNPAALCRDEVFDEEICISDTPPSSIPLFLDHEGEEMNDFPRVSLEENQLPMDQEKNVTDGSSSNTPPNPNKNNKKNLP
eukprot:TRINITY_DN6939_c0_g1_i1.p2 TRINITY_DN6939_c0_g1~~TRINITY_DN6939_c0_g1_i1.p2  ORF type:complete len:120 (+),score=23.31 TRINITY_DN6939_c0_g1_i1:569-928(+)